ncbi:MAG: 3-hydroxyacyl-CoA dehydrogenase [Methylobacterium sp.]|jgi:L-gulonate 3-dehydrogenase|nr:3-hydroxyacyl-CoA dehydrogenase [Methylobacterium sp.]MCA3774927.1 3-hydroxyacyl-CoA dehydrogenase [Cutibacterium sp.]MCE2931526.1 3-hydroxyacyl-CoA dehydrogenase [Hyphomicrobiales bacterium]MCA3653535.1 3-hydroxyacyl-CoA dehydrogenase [Methylobacterium sp.]MCA3657940.1 3-hydroxyacyl-CoA dehydrogenase [Methylobacterium sp.]
MTKIAIIGSGLIGRAWATIFASHGFEVAMHDPVPDVAKAARAHIGRNLRELAGHGLVDDPAAALKRIRLASGLADALAGAALAQESGPETVETKRALFAEMDRLAPKSCILASSTSFIVASVFSEGLPGRHRCLVAHPVNPPHLVPIVELAPASWTDPKVVERARKLYEKAGQVPITLRKESPGFVLNRLQAVLLAEAFRIVGAGICSPKDLDKTIRDGLGLRWSFMGPFETIELNAPGGIPDYAARYAPSLEAMVKQSEGVPAFTPDATAKIMAEWAEPQNPERVKRLSDWRDRRLAALKAHKRRQTRKPN